MAGPWEKYAAQGDGPLSKYAAPAEKPVDPSAGGGRLSIAGFDTGINTPQWLDRGLAGIGKAVVDTGRGIGQLVAPIADANASAYASQRGLPYQGNENQVAARQAVTDSRQADAPLMKTGMGKLGNFAGNAAMLAPTMAIPGANTVTGAGLIGAATGMIQPAETGTERAMNVGLGGALGAGAQYAGSKIAQAGTNLLASREASAVAKKTQNAVKDATVKELQSVGYVAPPTATNASLKNTILESAAGRAATNQAASLKDQQITNTLARKAIGLADDANLTPETFAEVRRVAGESSYKPISQIGDIPLDEKFTKGIEGLSRKVTKGLKTEGMVSDPVMGLQKGTMPINSADAIERLKDLRAEANANLSPLAAVNPANRRLGNEQKKAAKELEGLLDRHLRKIGKADLAEKFVADRKLIAKTHTLERALNEGTGNIDASKLARELDKGKPLEGEMLQIAKFGKTFKDIAKEPTKGPAVSKLDFATAVAAALTGHPELLAIPAASHSARAAILQPAINRALSAPVYGPGLGGTLAIKGARGLGQAAVPLALSVQASQQ